MSEQFIKVYDWMLDLDLSGKEIDIRKTEDTYCVTLPLL